MKDPQNDGPSAPPASARLLEEARAAIRAREDLLAIVSHDLLNPLGAVSLGATQIDRLAGDPRAAKTIHASVRLILGAVEQMNHLIGDLLDLSKLEGGHLLSLSPSVFDAGELVRTAVEQMAPLATARHLDLAAEIATGAGRLCCDGLRILQVFSNLIGNAIRFTREGGSIVVRAERSDSEILFSVADTGIGVSEEMLTHVFDPYWQGATTRKIRLGLGLAVTKGIVEAHGGRITMTSALDRGSTVVFSLPALDGERPPAKDPT